MTEVEKQSRLNSVRILVFGIIAVVLVLGLALIIRLTTFQGTSFKVQPVDALANSTDACVDCHRKESPGIVQQFSYSTMAAANVICTDCHTVDEGYPGAVAHEGGFVLQNPTTAMCQNCHPAEVDQFYASRHALPAHVAVFGSKELSEEHLAMYKAIPEGQFAPDKSRNAIAAIEGEDITRFACETCHEIGKPAADGSVGQCNICHLRHSFTLEQARKPETCNNCHIGPDHPQWEIYHESPHGIAYYTSGDTWNWTAEPGTLTVQDFPAPTCATCHFSGFGGAETTHDAGDRLAWYLFAPLSERRPDWESNTLKMQSICLECHNSNFIAAFYSDADKGTLAINDLVMESDAVIQPLKDNSLLTDAPFDEPIDFVYFELWHHWGRTAKFGMWMQGADYVQWHGAYEMINDLSEMRDIVAEKLEKIGK